MSMKILFLEGDMSRKGGTERMTALLANALAETNAVTVASLRLEGGEVYYKLSPDVEHKILSPVSGRAGIIKQIGEIRRLIKEKNADIVINVDIGMGLYGIIAAKGTKAKVITWEHSNFFNNWGSRLFPYLRRFAAKHSDALVVLTERDRENYASGIKSRTPVFAIPNPAERHEFSYDEDSKTIVSAGTLLPIKGYDRAVEAGKTVFAAHPDWKWRICGEGPERAKLEAAIKEAVLTENIILCGNIDGIADEYRRAAMCVMTSRSEGLPMALLEAKSFGLPLVSFDIMTGPSDIIRDGVNGFLIQPDNVADLAEKICRLIENNELRKSFSAQSQLDMDKFDFNAIIAKWNELFKEA